MERPDQFIGASEVAAAEPRHWMNRAAVALAEAKVCPAPEMTVVLRRVAIAYEMLAHEARQLRVERARNFTFDRFSEISGLSGTVWTLG